jgi:hypothetical protein
LADEDEVRRTCTGYFIPVEIAELKDLTLSQKWLLSMVRSLAAGRRGCFASNARFAKILMLKLGTVKDMFADLRKKGYVENVGTKGMLAIRACRLPDPADTSDRADITAPPGGLNRPPSADITAPDRRDDTEEIKKASPSEASDVQKCTLKEVSDHIYVSWKAKIGAPNYGRLSKVVKNLIASGLGAGEAGGASLKAAWDAYVADLEKRGQIGMASVERWAGTVKTWLPRKPSVDWNSRMPSA